MSATYTEEELNRLPRKGDVAELAEKHGLSTEGTRAEITARLLKVPEVEPAVEDPTAPPAIEEPPIGEAELKVKLRPPSKRALSNFLGGFLGVEAAAEVLDEVVFGVEAGFQPCLVKGSGNARYELKIFDQPFVVGDVAQDVPRVDNEVAVNLCRTLADKNLYPRG